MTKALLIVTPFLPSTSYALRLDLFLDAEDVVRKLVVNMRVATDDVGECGIFDLSHLSNGKERVVLIPEAVSIA